MAEHNLRRTSHQDPKRPAARRRNSWAAPGSSLSGCWSALLARAPHGKTVMREAENHLVPIVALLAGDALVIDEHAVGAVQILEHRVHGTGENDRVVAADELGVDLQIIVRRASDAGLAAENVNDLTPLLVADQEACRPFGQGLVSGLVCLGGGLSRGRRALRRVGCGAVGTGCAGFSHGQPPLAVGTLQFLQTRVATARL